MEASSLNDLKKVLKDKSATELAEICLRVARFKKENKELMTYLIFESGNESEYINKVKKVLDEHFIELPKYNLYLVYKVLRKIQRTAGRYIKYSGKKQTEAEINIYLYKKIKKTGIKLHQSAAIENMVQQLEKKIIKAISTLHEDLQYDLKVELEKAE